MATGPRVAYDHDREQDPELQSDPARKIWAEMRQNSGEDRPNYHGSRTRRGPSVAETMGSLGRPMDNPASSPLSSGGTEPCKTTPTHTRSQVASVHHAPGNSAAASGSLKGQDMSDVERERAVFRERALRNRRSVGPETLRSLVPTLADFSMTGRRGRDARPVRASGLADAMACETAEAGVGFRGLGRKTSQRGRETERKTDGDKDKHGEAGRWGSWTGWWQ